MTYILSIEEHVGVKAKQYPYHLGTDEHLARQIAQEYFHNRIEWGYPTVTVALILDGRMVACYDGTWM